MKLAFYSYVSVLFVLLYLFFLLFEESRVSSRFLQDSKQKRKQKQENKKTEKTTKSIWIIKSQIIECFKDEKGRRRKTQKLTIFHLFCLFKMLSLLLLLFSICLLMEHKANKIWDKIIKIRINGFLFHYKFSRKKTISTPNIMEIGDDSSLDFISSYSKRVIFIINILTTNSQ